MPEPEFKENQSKRRGPPTKLTQKLAKKIYWLAELGLTDEQISYAVDISEDTINRWKKSSVFDHALSKAKDKIDLQVEKSLLKRAMGMKTIKRVYTEHNDGIGTDGKPRIRKTQTMIEEELPPDPKCLAIWLYNRRGDKWRERGNLFVSDDVEITDGMTDEEIAEKMLDAYGEKAKLIYDFTVKTLALPPTTTGDDSKQG